MDVMIGVFIEVAGLIDVPDPLRGIVFSLSASFVFVFVFVRDNEPGLDPKLANPSKASKVLAGPVLAGILDNKAAGVVVAGVVGPLPISTRVAVDEGAEVPKEGSPNRVPPPPPPPPSPGEKSNVSEKPSKASASPFPFVVAAIASPPPPYICLKPQAARGFSSLTAGAEPSADGEGGQRSSPPALSVPFLRP